MSRMSMERRSEPSIFSRFGQVITPYGDVFCDRLKLVRYEYCVLGRLTYNRLASLRGEAKAVTPNLTGRGNLGAKRGPDHNCVPPLR
jgi:hypothetical protein